MGKLTVAQAAAWCGGEYDPRYGGVTFDGAGNDSRKIRPGQLFVALRDVRDGHDFIPQALEQGAAAVLCSRITGDYPAIIVPDTRKALGDIAKGYRQNSAARVVGITGSVGKSTTKEMTAAVLEKKHRVGKTPVNFNNDVGLPLSILGMPEDVEVMVLEMGMNHFGELSYLTSIAQPDIAVIVNIGTMHIEHLGSREGILQAKLEILEGLRPGGHVVLAGDEPLLRNLPQGLQPIYFGMTEKDCHTKLLAYEKTGNGCSFTACLTRGSCPVRLPLVGEHNALDALAAMTVGELLDVPLAAMAEALAAYTVMGGRQEILAGRGCTLIKDCYNAGPESMAASLRVLAGYEGDKIAVLGDMLELGSVAPRAHYDVGRKAAGCCRLLLALGDFSGDMVKGALDGGMKPEQCFCFADRQTMALCLREKARPGETILFKGSRGMKMEQVLELFLRP